MPWQPNPWNKSWTAKSLYANLCMICAYRIILMTIITITIVITIIVIMMMMIIISGSGFQSGGTKRATSVNWEQTNTPLLRCHPDRLTKESDNKTPFSRMPLHFFGCGARGETQRLAKPSPHAGPSAGAKNCTFAQVARLAPSVGWHYLSNATCLMQPHLFSTALLV